MRDSTFALFLAQTVPLEGKALHMYPDVLGLVTTAIGVKIDPMPDALRLSWYHLGTGAKADPNEVASAWVKVKQSGLGKLGGLSPQVIALTDLRLQEHDADALVRAKCAGNEAILAAFFPAWDAMPDTAQAGALMLAWACGPDAITTPGPHHFPRFAADLAAGNYAELDADGNATGGCALECIMPASANPGNSLEARNRATAALFVRAQASIAVTQPGP